jgi:hypothetical protein
VLIEVRHIGSDFDVGRRVETTGIKALARHDDHTQMGNQVLDEWLGRDDFPQERSTHAGYLGQSDLAIK